VVIVGEDSPLQNVTVAELRKVFASTSDSIQGTRLTPLNHPAGSALRVQFDAKVLGMSPAQVGRYWIDRRLRSQPGPPRSVDSSALLKRVTARLAGRDHIRHGRIS
jgi:hypothetical protein